jgi:hypothetical protein
MERINIDKTARCDQLIQVVVDLSEVFNIPSWLLSEVWIDVDRRAMPTIS